MIKLNIYWSSASLIRINSSAGFSSISKTPREIQTIQSPSKHLKKHYENFLNNTLTYHRYLQLESC